MLSLSRLYALDSNLLLKIAIVPCIFCRNVLNFKPFQFSYKMIDPIQLQYPWVFALQFFNRFSFEIRGDWEN